MAGSLGSGISRRSLIGIAAAGAAGALGFKASGRQAGEDVLATCATEPAVDMLFRWRSGAPVYASVAENGPQIDWVPIQPQATSGPFLIPPRWSAYSGWADSFTRDGLPEWQERPVSAPQLSATRVVSPDGEALFEYAVGAIQGVLLTTEQSSGIARGSIVGADANLRPVCMYDDQDNVVMPGWFSVDRHRSRLLITSGNASTLPSDVLPATVVSYTAMYGRRRDMEDLMHDVFLRILYQFLGGGSGDPTPTSTPMS